MDGIELRRQVLDDLHDAHGVKAGGDRLVMHFHQGAVTAKVEVRQPKSPKDFLGGPRYKNDHFLVVAGIGIGVGTKVGQYFKFGVGTRRGFIVGLRGSVKPVPRILVPYAPVVLTRPCGIGSILRWGRVDPEVAFPFFAFYFHIRRLRLLKQQRQGFPLPDDDPIGPTGVRGAVRLGVHRGGRHDEIVPLQRRHHRPIVEDAFLLAYLLTIHQTRYAVFVLDDLWDDVLGAVFVGIRRVGQ